MGNTVSLKFTLNDDGSIDAATGRVKKLNQELAQTKKLAPAATRGAGSENVEYGRGRGAMGATGAGARNFANEAQGLGGLVRLYATYAANLFAVTAAFKALSDAMDTTNMVQGLNQLSAASGQSLGSLSKQFSDASGGAISFREAMEATAKGTAAGLTSKQMMQLGDVAKKASQALGINMPDAVSRLTRGISKLEPELLDELGLFTKVGKATEDYARRVGKSVDSLTDFERRQAFANAVLKEGNDKFSEINIPTNPYDKLAASLKNVGQQILEVVNKYLTPLVELLANSPTGLAVGIGFLAKMVVSSALPAIRNYREELKNTAEEAKKFADTRATLAKAAMDARKKEIMARSDAKAEAATEAISTAETALKTAMSGRIRKDVRAILDKTPLDVTDKELDKLDKLGSKLKNVDNVYNNLAKTIREAKTANQQYIDLDKKLTKEVEQPGRFSAAGKAIRDAEMARRKAASSGIISGAGESAAIEGLGPAFSKAMGQIKTEKLGLVRSIITGIGVVANIAAVAVTRLASALNTAFMVVAILTTAYEIFEGIFGGNSKQVDVFKDKLEDLEATTKTAADTNRKYADSLSGQKIIAQADAFGNLVDSINSVTQAYKDAQDASTWWDRFTDNIAGLFGKSLSDKIAAQLSSSINTALNTISSPELKQATEDQIKQLLNIKDISEAKSALKKIEDSPEFDKTNAALKKILDTAKSKSQELALPIRAVKDGFDQLQKSYDEFSNSLINKDPFTKFGLELLQQTNNLKKAFADPTNQLAVLNDLLKDTSKLNAFPPESRAGLLQAAKDTQGLNEELEQARKLMNIDVGGAQGFAKEQILKLKVEGSERFAIATEKLKSINENLTTGLNASMVQGFKLIEAPLTRAYQQANIDVAKTLVSALPKTPESVAFQTKLDVQVIDLRKQEITEMRNLVNAITLDRISREEIALDEKLKTATSDTAREKLLEEKKPLEQQRRALRGDMTLGKDGEVVSPEAARIIANQVGYRSQIAGLNAQQQSIVMGGIVKEIEAGYAQAKVVLQQELDSLAAQNKAFYASVEFQGLSPLAQEAERARRQAQETQRAGVISDLGPMQGMAVGQSIAEQAAQSKTLSVENRKQLIKLGNDAVNLSSRELTVNQGNRDTTAKTLELELARAQSIKAIVLDMEHAADLEAFRLKNAELSMNQSQNILAEELSYLQAKREQGMLSEQQYLNESKVLTTKQLQADLDRRIFELNKSRNQELDALQKKMVDLGPDGDPKELERLTNLKNATDTYYNTSISNEKSLYDLKLRTKALTESLTDRQRAYGDIFQKTFDGMADALLNFVTTGKLNYKDLINSMLSDLARYELRLQTTALYQAMRPGLMNFLSPFASQGAAGAVSSDVISVEGAVNAKGGVYDAGVKMFAKGGTFTNGIVDSPTLFKFAKGTGLMGEAGPEAIMPLKRDGNGNLGVRANAQKTEVVVNNYGNDKATATETVDSRGNRRIEVTVGDMTAGEISRSGSGPQRAIRNTFGIQPKLIRR